MADSSQSSHLPGGAVVLSDATGEPRTVMLRLPRWMIRCAVVAAAVCGTTAAAQQAGKGVQAKKQPALVKSASAPQARAPSARPAIPAPQRYAEEAAHVARYDKAIAPVRTLALGSEDAQRIHDAFAALARNDNAKATALRNAVTDPVGRKLVTWALLRNGGGSAREINAFLAANPVWPERTALARRAEEALFATGTARDITAAFKDSPPVTMVGRAALAWAYLSDGDSARAKALAVKIWQEDDLPASVETVFLARLGKLLTPADHKRRLNRLLLDDSRWAGERNERAALVRRMLPLLPEAERKTAEARLAVFLRAKGSEAKLAAVAKDHGSDWGLAFQRAQALRRTGKHAESWKILLQAPVDPAVVTGLDDWWEERRASAYDALKADNPRMAYNLVRNPGPLSVNPLKDAQFLAGWIALRRLKEPKAALAHFKALSESADGPLSHAKAAYWLGRTYEALGDSTQATASYRGAVKYFDTFHGQLARLKLDPHDATLDIRAPAVPTEEERQRFNGLDAVKAAVVAKKSALEPWVSRALLGHLRFTLKTEAEEAMLAHLAEALGDTQMAVRIGKTAIARGLNLVYYAYPIHPLPAYTPLRPPPETAFILGIARQESEFNTLTLSGAGARGLLQVMPITARHVCHDYKLKCEIERLMKDPSYNAMMGTAYIGDRMDEFNGSYVLTLAGYNAGPGRARQWMREFGDPRNPDVDPLDWIFRIPFEETREYVQKVLANIQVYRARLGDEKHALRLSADLKRAVSR
jgi:soluble lytic murein transglycosylase